MGVRERLGVNMGVRERVPVSVATVSNVGAFFHGCLLRSAAGGNREAGEDVYPPHLTEGLLATTN